MEQAIAQFSSFPQTPKERDSFVEMCISEIESGERNPLDFEIMLKNLEEVIEKIRKDDRVKKCVQAEAEKYLEKTFQYGNYEICKMSKTTYDYSNDQKWKDLKAEIKSRETLLKAINPKVEDIASTNTGDILQPPLKKSTDYLTIKYKQ